MVIRILILLLIVFFSFIAVDVITDFNIDAILIKLAVSVTRKNTNENSISTWLNYYYDYHY